MIVVSPLIVANVFLLAHAPGVGTRTAFAVGLTLAIGTPILTYSCLVFVEPIGALGCVYALRLLHTPTLRTRDLLLVSTCLGVLPWVHARFLLFPPLFLTFLLLRLRRDNATRPRVLAALTPALLLIASFEVFNLVVWHTLSPAPNQVSIGAVPFQKNPPQPLWKTSGGVAGSADRLSTRRRTLVWSPAGSSCWTEQSSPAADPRTKGAP